MTHTIPRSITLPFGYKVKIVQVPYEDLLHLGTEDNACWMVESQILYLDKDLPLPQKRYWIMSQMHHIVLDANHAMLDDGFMSPS